MLLWNSTKNGHKKPYWHPKFFKIIFKSDSYLMLISRRGPVTPSTPTFPNTNNNKQLKIYLLFQKSQKNGCNNLYYHPYSFNER